MRSIAIIGAGQSGLQLAIALKKNNYDVTLFSERSADEIRQGRIMSSQCMFHTALSMERRWTLDFWHQKAPQNQCVSFAIADPQGNQPLFSWQGKTEYPFQSIDQRLKFSTWIKEFQTLGGNFQIKSVNRNDLDYIGKSFELTIIAGGKGEITHSFARDNTKSTFEKPQRILSCIYAKGAITSELTGVHANIVPGVGEFFVVTGLSATGPCEMMLFEGIPGGPFADWHKEGSADENFSLALSLLKKYIPWEAERFLQADVADENAFLTGSYTPTIKHPVMSVNQISILGIGDAVVLNDPIAGQGANNASKAADVCLQSILQHGQNSFDASWMQTSFTNYWERYAKWSSQWSCLLLAPLEPHIIRLLSVAQEIPALANFLANSFDDPSCLFPWIMDAGKTEKMIKTMEKK